MFKEVKKTLPVDVAVCTAAIADFKFKKIINRLIANGQITKEKGRNYSAQGAVPEVMKVRVIEFNEDRFCFVCEAYDQENLKNRSIFIREKDAPKARANDYFIVRLHEKDNKLWLRIQAVEEKQKA